MKNKIFIFLLALFAIPFSIWAQGKIEITGTVTDENGEPLVGVSILDGKSGKGVSTDVNGVYQINISDKSTELKFFMLGYLDYSAKPGKGNRLDVILKQDNIYLDETIVVGYGSMKKSDLTGAVSSIKSESLQQIATINLSEMLKGQIAGLDFNQTSTQPEQKSNCR